MPGQGAEAMFLKDDGAPPTQQCFKAKFQKNKLRQIFSASSAESSDHRYQFLSFSLATGLQKLNFRVANQPIKTPSNECLVLMALEDSGLTSY